MYDKVSKTWGCSNTPPSGARVKRAIECAFSRCCSPSGFRVLCRFVGEKYANRQNLIFGGLWLPNFWPDLKMTEAVSSWFFDTLSNAAYCVSLHGPGVELEGVFNSPSPGPARSPPSSGPARVHPGGRHGPPRHPPAVGGQLIAPPPLLPRWCRHNAERTGREALSTHSWIDSLIGATVWCWSHLKCRHSDVKDSIIDWRF